MFDIHKHEIIRCSINEFNNILSTLDDRVIIYDSAHHKDVGARIYLWSVISKAYLVFNIYSNSVITKCYETDLNDNYEDGYLTYIKSVKEHSSKCGKAFKFPRVVEDKSQALVNASGILWSNKKYRFTNTYCYEYDMHLAWLSTFMTCPLPDTTNPPRLNDIVKEGEIGFVKDGYSKYGCKDCVVFSGFANYIFPIMYNPNPKFCNDLLNKINNAQNPLIRRDLKGTFNEWLGTMQNKNPYIRVAVIAQSNKKIIDLISKYKDKIVYSVTDSLGTIERIKELDDLLSDDCGGWCIKNSGILYCTIHNRLYLDENGYITNPVVYGVPKEHIIGMHIDEYNKLMSKVDVNKNLYKIDNKQRRIIRNG